MKKKTIIVLLSLLTFILIITFVSAILLAQRNSKSNNVIYDSNEFNENIADNIPLIQDENLELDEPIEDTAGKVDTDTTPTTSTADKQTENKNTDANKESSNNSNTNKQESNTNNTTSVKEESNKVEENNSKVETNDNNKEETNNSTETKVWEQLGMSEYDYYNKPIWTWATKTHNTLDSCVDDGEKAKQEELDKNSGKAVIYTCHHLYSHSGNYVGEMLEVEYLG